MFKVDPDLIQDDDKYAIIANQASWLFTLLYAEKVKK